MSWEDWVGDGLGALIILTLLVFLVAVVFAAIYDEKTWNRYAAAHHCVAIGKKEASNGLGLDGKAVFIPEQTIYRCDGGEEIIR